jgi:hypothetical protein
MRASKVDGAVPCKIGCGKTPGDRRFDEPQAVLSKAKEGSRMAMKMHFSCSYAESIEADSMFTC